MKNRFYKKLILAWIIICLISPTFSFAQPIKSPETLQEVKEIGEMGFRELPSLMKRVWQEEARPILAKTFDWIKTNIFSPIFNWLKNLFINLFKKLFQWLFQWLTNLFQREVKPRIEKEIEKRTTVIKEEIKEEIPKIGQSLWERFKELIK